MNRKSLRTLMILMAIATTACLVSAARGPTAAPTAAPAATTAPAMAPTTAPAVMPTTAPAVGLSGKEASVLPEDVLRWAQDAAGFREALTTAGDIDAKILFQPV